ncbi:SWIM zinc finger family protein [Chitinophaga silvatica]|uniref:SWIM zinc finger family protein n=1 Tax=Chitinophaga silvatica TaxID=2282649 RepID=A0A3E1YHL6_9BACT|nr:SWIM zinc finger family protein [Chitinophaga silvatica]RFS26847.1 SWIM zinc finger family protein [Chitinophaga silvatica]
MLNLSDEQVLALAPDDSSRKSGKDLANPAKWVSKGVNEQALWGECQGSGSKPYQTQIDINDMAFKCSCPSRKFPCKHGLGLMLLYSRQSNSFTDTAPPAWVSEWLAKRAEKEEKKAVAAANPKAPDPKAQAKRLEARSQKVQDGIAELTQWLKDMVRNGIMDLPEKDQHFFENISRRMIDAQAPGLANMLKELSEISFYQEGWQSPFLEQLARIYLVTKGFENIEQLPEPLRQDLRSLIGFTVSQDELKEQPGISDSWLILGKQTTEEDRLITDRYWLYGQQTKRKALVLQFYMRNQGLPPLTLVPGTCIQAEVAFYPSAAPLRAVIRQHSTISLQPAFTGYSNWEEVMVAQTEISEVLPCYNDQVYTINNITPVFHQSQWWLQDSQMQLMPVKKGFKEIWKLLAISGGQSMPMAVIGKGTSYEPIGIWKQQEYNIL